MKLTKQMSVYKYSSLPKYPKLVEIFNISLLAQGKHFEIQLKLIFLLGIMTFNFEHVTFYPLNTIQQLNTLLCQIRQATSEE